MRGRIRRQAPARLLELPLAAHTVTAAGLVPRDRDVNEPLQEVSLRRLGGSPGVLELLVRGEILAAADQLQPAVETRLPFRHRLDRNSARDGLQKRGECYSRHVTTILLAGVDLYFRGKLEGLLPAHHLVTADSADAPDLVIVDIARVDPDEVADAYPEVPILGFSNHTDTSGLRRAHEAGFDQVVAKSALVERANDLVQELTA